MTRNPETDRDRLDPEQVDELLRELLEHDPAREASPTRWNAAFCASGGKGPVCL
jgi:hypothetical protein